MGRYKTWNGTEPEINNYIKLILIELFNLNNIGRKRGMTSELVLISSDEYDSLSSSSSPRPLPPPFKKSKSVPLLVEDSPTKFESISILTYNHTKVVTSYIVTY